MIKLRGLFRTIYLDFDRNIDYKHLTLLCGRLSEDELCSRMF